MPQIDNMHIPTEQVEWAENVLLVDADFLDQLVFDITAQLERVLNRRLPSLHLTRWADFVCLDAGLRPGNNDIQVLIIYDSPNATARKLQPAELDTALNGKACRTNLGELCFASFPVEPSLTTRWQLFAQSAQVLLQSSRVKRLMLVGDMTQLGQQVPAAAKALTEALNTAEGKSITVFQMQAQADLRCQQELLSYSLMAALGIRPEDLP